jgi:hypothetical protein
MFLPDSRWFLGSLEFLTNKFGNLILQETELSEVIGSDTGRLPSTSVRVGLINEAQVGLGSLGEKDTYSVEDRTDHTLAALVATTDPIYSPPSGSDSEYRGEVYMVEQGGEMPEKTTKELQREVEEEIAHAEQLARELNKRKGHNGLHDDSRGSKDECLDGAPTRRNHPMFNSHRNTDIDRLRHSSRLIREEFDRFEYQGEQVYRMPAHNALASRMLVNQITPISPRIMKRSTRMSSSSRQCLTRRR